jgi:DNA-directed RNA polymerase III subunit RPC6
MATDTAVPKECEALYNRCKELATASEDGWRKIFTQNELLELCDSDPLQNIKSGDTLLPLVINLTTNKLFLTVRATGGTSNWSLRRESIAKTLRGLTRDECMVYEIIENTYMNGIWIKNIKKRSGINDGKSMEKLIAKLVRLSLIKTVKNVKAPAQKTYMLYNLAPSDDVTGGSFYDQGDLDESLVDQLSNVIVFHVRMASWVERRRKKIKMEEKDDGDLAEVNQVETTKSKGKKRKRDSEAQPVDIEDLIQPRKNRSYKHTHDPETEPDMNNSTWLLHPADEHEYPTAKSVHEWIIGNTFLADEKARTVSVDEIQNIINVLVWDGKLEECGNGYRTVRGVQPFDPGRKKPGEEDGVEDVGREEKRGNGLTEMPCGRCPVLHDCAPGALISPASCVYFEEWLNDGAIAV